MKKAIKTILTVGTIAMSTISYSTMNMQVKTDYETEIKAKEQRAEIAYERHLAKWLPLREAHDASTCEICQDASGDSFGSDYSFEVCSYDVNSPHYSGFKHEEHDNFIEWYIDNY